MELTLSPQPKTEFILTINGLNGFLVKIRYDGTIEYGPDYTPDAAAKILWEAIAGYIPKS